MTRPTFSKSQRLQIAERDGWVCGICKTAIGKYEAFEVDHHHALGRGGEHADDNFRAVHKIPCHRDKSKIDTKEYAKTKRIADEHEAHELAMKRGARRLSKKAMRIADIKANAIEPVGGERQTTEVDQ